MKTENSDDMKRLIKISINRFQELTEISLYKRDLYRAIHYINQKIELENLLFKYKEEE